MINSFNIYTELFEEIDKICSINIDIFIIGGAVMLYRKLKPATKDIDLVVNTKEEYEELKKILKEIGFIKKALNFGYKKFNIDSILVKDDIQVDIFLKKVCSKFRYSKAMIKRAENIKILSKIKVFLSSNEDIFAFKTMTDREGDISDCIELIKSVLEWDVIFIEIKSQGDSSGQDIWITWINERFIDLEKKGVEIPILDETNRLSEDYYDANL